MSTTSRLMTAEELLMMPSDHQRHELVKGELTTMAPANSEHGATIVNLTVPLANHVKSKSLGVVFGAETGFLIEQNPDTVRAPDIAFVSAERIKEKGIPARFWPGAPDLAVEVISPGDTVYEVEQKVDDWLAAAPRMVWVVNLKTRSVTVHCVAETHRILRIDDILDGGDVIQGFHLPVREIFV